MSSSTIAVAVNFAASVVVPLKSNVGLAIAALAERLLEERDVRELVVAHGRGERRAARRESAPPATACT